MTSDKNRNGRSTPPEDGDDWADLWSGNDKSHKAWIVIGPVVAFVQNWKAIAAVVVVVVWMNRPEIIDALGILIGSKK